VRGGSVAAAVALASWTGAAAARADICSDAFTQSAQLSRAGKLVEARAALRVCAADSCPATMKPLCVHDLESLEPRISSVVVRAREPGTGHDLVDVRVRVDGALLEDSLDGKARDVDPGVHTFRFERTAAAPVEQQIVIVEGEKARPVDVQWQAESSSVATPRRRPIPWSVWLTGGLTVASAAVWAIAGIDGNLAGCKGLSQGCSRPQIQGTETAFNVADVAGGTTIALAALTTVLVLTRPAVAQTVGWIGRGLALRVHF
jgi:hypothetical protein